ncbi:hypothetical protein AMAG_20697 [Allomyces macrogynus ATCC 38327]|uniref:Uncharacterized protein n=1 Tax=Allomyces macrogynus (strain ATCC 38327) TaxID=578462 RepID=A0A0L0TEQ2_ALLM3|nr:hypothetical protein AMAG_20697 [Allomyces macrogynus ATCC 38327]|eukprot:KNE73175.1 hypothetical protein AMAG_20697 [Allomyces macrogynus ATCC 38327]
MFTTIGGVATASVTDSYADDSAALHGTDSYLDDFLTSGRAALADLADQRHVLKRMHQRNRACRRDRYAPSNLGPSVANHVNFSRTEPSLTSIIKGARQSRRYADNIQLIKHRTRMATIITSTSSPPPYRAHAYHLHPTRRHIHDDWLRRRLARDTTPVKPPLSTKPHRNSTTS